MAVHPSARCSSLALPVICLALAWTLPCAAVAPPPKPSLDQHGDPLPAGAVARLGTIRFHYQDGFHQAVLSPDGCWLVSSASQGKLLVWETATGRLMRT